MSSEIKFTNGSAYHLYMGRWSQLVAHKFLSWLSLNKDLRWLDIGCGNGAFTEIVSEVCSPKSLHGIDPSEAQLAFAKSLPLSPTPHFQIADAMSLPFKDRDFDAAVMPLVLFFVPDPDKGLAEMKRVLAPGGVAAAYTWDMYGSGFPYIALREELEAIGVSVPKPVSVDATEPETMKALWSKGGLKDVEITSIEVQRTFESHDDYWSIVSGGPSVGPKIAALSPSEAKRVQERLKERLPADSEGRITYAARANAVKGRV